MHMQLHGFCEWQVVQELKEDEAAERLSDKLNDVRNDHLVVRHSLPDAHCPYVAGGGGGRGGGGGGGRRRGRPLLRTRPSRRPRPWRVAIASRATRFWFWLW